MLSESFKVLLSESKTAQIINTTSVMHWFGTSNFTKLGHRQKGFRAYANSKSAIMLYTAYLAKELKPLGVSVNTFDPGIVGTDIGTNNGGFFKWVSPLFKKITRTARIHGRVKWPVWQRNCLLFPLS